MVMCDQRSQTNPNDNNCCYCCCRCCFPFSLAFAADVVIVLLLRRFVFLFLVFKCTHNGIRIRTFLEQSLFMLLSLHLIVQLCSCRSSNSSCCYSTPAIIYMWCIRLVLPFRFSFMHTQIHIAYLYTYGHKKNKVHTVFFSSRAAEKLFSISSFIFHCVSECAMGKGGGVCVCV